MKGKRGKVRKKCQNQAKIGKRGEKSESKGETSGKSEKIKPELGK